ncbi:MAG: PD-(D/E)XK nuclease family protein, partial [Brevinema sp.]
MSVNNIELLVKEISQVIQIEKDKEKLRPGKMSLLSMFRHEYENSHSDVLRYLLDPNEDHRHGAEYLDLFLKEVGFGDLCKYDLTECKIYRESARIDLYIEHEEFSIIIENKIRNNDQPQQLQRYYEIVNEKWKVNENQIYIIYLTLSGYNPSEQSMGNSEDSDDKAKEIYQHLQELRDSKKFLDISYNYHILRWLRQLSFKSNEHTLRSAIEQYIYNLEILTQQTEEEIDMTKEILQIFEKTNIKDNREECFAIINIMNMYLNTFDV